MCHSLGRSPRTAEHVTPRGPGSPSRRDRWGFLTPLHDLSCSSGLKAATPTMRKKCPLGTEEEAIRDGAIWTGNQPRGFPGGALPPNSGNFSIASARKEVPHPRSKPTAHSLASAPRGHSGAVLSKLILIAFLHSSLCDNRCRLTGHDSEFVGFVAFKLA